MLALLTEEEQQSFLSILEKVVAAVK